MTATQTVEIAPDVDIDEHGDEIAWCVAFARAALKISPTGWLAEVDWTTVTEDGDTWRECRVCGLPEDEMCAWCGCECRTATRVEVENEPCVSLREFPSFLREFGSARWSA